MPEEEKQEEKSEEKSEEQKEEAKVKEQQEQWDKEKQRADQVEANYQKLTIEKETIDDQLVDTIAKVEELEEQIRVKKVETETELAKMDTDLVDRSVIANFEKMQATHKAMEEKMAALEKKASQYEEAETVRQATADKESRREKILKPLDEQYGAKYRNDAMKMANDLIQKGQAKEPPDAIDAYLLLEKCYKKLSDETTEKEKPKKVPVDTGTGGFDFGKEDLKEGTFNEVTAQMKKEGKFKGITFPVP